MNPSARLLCPVCRDNIKIGKFESHVKSFEDLHKHLIPFMTKKFFDVIYIASDLKGNSNNVYFNWKYHIMSSYTLTQNDKDLYESAVNKIENIHGKFLDNKICDEIKKVDERYKVGVISDSMLDLNFQHKYIQ